jgi:hypothetical protein
LKDVPPIRGFEVTVQDVFGGVYEELCSIQISAEALRSCQLWKLQRRTKKKVCEQIISGAGKYGLPISSSRLWKQDHLSSQSGVLRHTDKQFFLIHTKNNVMPRNSWATSAA